MALKMAAAPPRAKASRNLKLSPSLPPVAAEVAALLDLKAVSNIVPSGEEIISEGKPCASVFLITEGWAIRSRTLHNGKRQILNFLLPGDFAGVTNSQFDNALYSVKTLTQAAISPVPLARLLGLFDTHPRLAVELFWSFTSEMAILGEHLIAIGRQSALKRIARLLLELHERLRRIGLANKHSHRLPLTQEMISDALGLSIPYVNRVLQQLRLDGLVTIKNQLVVIENVEELAALADFEHSYLRPLDISELRSVAALSARRTARRGVNHRTAKT
jgi:CRP/FNR family transcriptional regulator, anaerobic regulatory protein